MRAVIYARVNQDLKTPDDQIEKITKYFLDKTVRPPLMGQRAAVPAIE